MAAAEILTTKQAAALATVSDQTIRRWVESGILKPAFQLPGGAYRFHRADVEAAVGIAPVEAAS